MYFSQSGSQEVQAAVVMTSIYHASSPAVDMLEGELMAIVKFAV